MKKIAVLLTCHNRREKTLTCLKSLFEAELPDDYSIEVFLVDDGSIDGTSTAVKNYYKKVKILQGTGDLYWNRGMYLAWESATKQIDYDYVMWLNDDTLLFDDALNQMLEYLNIADNKRIVIGATCSAIDGTVTYSGFNFPNKKLIPNGQWQNCDYFNGNIVLIPSYIYHRIGILDKRFRHTLGDFDYGMRASKLGFVHALSPRCLGFCEDHETDPIWCNRSYALNKRLKHLYTPLGNNPIEFFRYDLRHFGLFMAILHFFTIHLRALSPSLWNKSK